MDTQSARKRGTGPAIALVAIALVSALAYRAGGMNWAAGVGTVLGISLWLWSARRHERAKSAHAGAKLIVDQVGEAIDEERARSSYRRLRVFNAGGRSLDRVEVKLVACRPTPAWFQPVRLQRMNGGAHPFSLPPRSEVYIDLIALPHGYSEFILVADSSVHGDVPNGIPMQRTELSVRVTADGLSNATFVFDVYRSASGTLEVSAKAPHESVATALPA